MPLKIIYFKHQEWYNELMKMKRKELDLTEFDKRFPSEKECCDYLYSLLFADGFRCPSAECQHEIREKWEVKPYKYKCRKCGHQTSLTAQINFFCHSHLPMLIWFKAIYYMCIRRERATATELKKLVDIDSDKIKQSNKTAQKMVRKIKPMLYRFPDEEKLYGKIAVGKEPINFSETQIDVGIAVEVNNKKIGRVVIVPISNVEDIYEAYLSTDADPQQLQTYTNKVARDFAVWCNKKEQERKEAQEDQRGIDVLNIDELMRIYSATTFLYRTPVDFDDVINNILNYGTEKDYSSYYDKSIV